MSHESFHIPTIRSDSLTFLELIGPGQRSEWSGRSADRVREGLVGQLTDVFTCTRKVSEDKDLMKGNGVVLCTQAS